MESVGALLIALLLHYHINEKEKKIAFSETKGSMLRLYFQVL